MAVDKKADKNKKTDATNKNFTESATKGTVSAQRKKALDDALAAVSKQFGTGAAMRLGDREVTKIETIQTGSLALDVALGIGGLPRGRIIEIYGPESSGKTTLTLHAAANAQKAGGSVAFVDAEHALDPVYAAKLGVDIDELIVSQPDTGEQALEIVDTFARSGAFDLIIVDSVAALTPRAEIEGEMGDSHMGLQARLMSQALRKLVAGTHGTNTTIIFINQLREKIGVMFGCFNYSTRVLLADGTTEKIGKIVNQKMPVSVLSYDADSGKIVPRKVLNWFDNGPAKEFLQFTVEKKHGNGRTQFGATGNHLIATPTGWESAEDIKIGDEIMVATQRLLSSEQLDFIKGSLMGDGSLSSLRKGSSPRFRMGHGIKQSDYLDWKASFLPNIFVSRRTQKDGRAVFLDTTPLEELVDLYSEVYQGKKNFSREYLESLSTQAWAVWYMDDGHLAIRSKGVQKRTQGLSGRVQICVEAMSPETRKNIVSVLADKFGIKVTLKDVAGKAIINIDRENTDIFLKLVAPFIHPSMEYKLFPYLQGVFESKPVETIEAFQTIRPAKVLNIAVKPKTKSMQRFDIEVEGNHNYFVDGAMVHNSPETTTGGKALKFYASVRMDIRKIEAIKDGTDVTGNRTRVKVVKNKMAPPFKQAEFDIIFGEGISWEGDVIDLGVQVGIVKRSGSWYTYGDDNMQLGQGKENARNFLRDNPELAKEIEAKILKDLGIGEFAAEGEVSEDGEEPTEE